MNLRIEHMFYDYTGMAVELLQARFLSESYFHRQKSEDHGLGARCRCCCECGSRPWLQLV